MPRRPDRGWQRLGLLAVFFFGFVHQSQAGSPDMLPPPLKGHNGRVFAVAFAPGGRVLASGGADKQIILWDVKSGKESRRLAGHTGTVFGLAFAPDGKTLASGSQDGTVGIWDVATGKEKARLQHGSWVYSVAYSPDGRTLASAGSGGKVKLWDVAAGKVRLAVRANQQWLDSAVWCVTASPDG